MKITEIKIGVCETCEHYYEEKFDPSPAGVSLGSGYMIDAGCRKDEELAKSEEDNEDLGRDFDNQCPLWEVTKALFYCGKHKFWVRGECSDCMAEAYQEMLKESR